MPIFFLLVFPLTCGSELWEFGEEDYKDLWSEAASTTKPLQFVDFRIQRNGEILSVLDAFVCASYSTSGSEKRTVQNAYEINMNIF